MISNRRREISKKCPYLFHNFFFQVASKTQKLIEKGLKNSIYRAL